MDNYYVLVIILLVLFYNSRAWDLSHIGITNYSILDVTVVKNRAYLSLKINNKSKNLLFPTLVEVPWPENEKFFQKARIYPSKEFHHKMNLQQTVSTDFDMHGRLWILDEGSQRLNYTTQLIIYNIHTNHIVQIFKLNNSDLKISSIKTDPRVLKYNQMAFIGVSNANIMFVCVLHHQCYEYVVENIKTIENIDVVSTESIAISKIDEKLFLTSQKNLPIFEIDLSAFDKDNLMENRIKQIDVTYLGEKLGPSKGLITDSGNGLIYYLTRDFAIVRWTSSKKFNAEGHDVLIQSFPLLPDVSQLISDSKGNVWAVVNRLQKDQKYKSKKYSIQPTCIKIWNNNFLF